MSHASRFHVAHEMNGFDFERRFEGLTENQRVYFEVVESDAMQAESEIHEMVNSRYADMKRRHAQYKALEDKYKDLEERYECARRDFLGMKDIANHWRDMYMAMKEGIKIV